MGNGFVSLDDRFHILQHKLQEIEIPVNDPKVKDLAKYFFGKDFENFDTFSKIQNYQGSLSSLVTEMGSREITERTIIKFCKTLLKTQKAPSLSHQLTPTREPPQKPIPLMFLCDIDAPDHNSAMLDRFNAGIASLCPIITSRDIFKCTNLRGKDSIVTYNRDQSMKALSSNYDIYANGAYLVFVPKKLECGAEALDLDLESLKQVTLKEAWGQTDDKPTLEGFQRLFSSHPTHNKLIYIAGHGGVGHPAALTGEHYKQFLKWAEKQMCQGLIITSCYSGGESSLLHLADRDVEKPTIFVKNSANEYVKKPVKDLENAGVQFPVFVRSVGDFPTMSGQGAEKNVGDFMEKIGNLINAPGGHSLQRLKKVVQEAEGTSKKVYLNLLQVYFPHSGDSPGGFRTVGEGGESSSLTYREYRKRQLEDGEIKVSNQSFLEIFPAFVECPITFIGKNPIILSMIPGKAHHLLTEVTLDYMQPKEFLAKNCESYKTADIGVTKTLFISHLKNSLGNELNQVFVNLKTGAAGFRDKDSYYLWDALKKGEPMKVSPFQYLLSWKEAVAESTPKSDAVRRASGGQQNEQLVLKHLEQESFWGSQETYNQYHAIESLESMNLTESDIISYIAYLLPKNEKLASSLFENGNFSPDSKDALGVPLLVIATQRNCHAFAELLLKKGADPNLPHPKTLAGNLEIALRSNDETLVDMLLQHESIDLKTVNAAGNQAFMLALSDPKILKKCLKKDPHLDLNVECIHPQTKETYSLLGVAVCYYSLESVKLLLEAGADPNCLKGKYSPLSEAIIANDEKKIDLLLQWNANPFQKDKSGGYPIAEAMSRSSISTVEKLWESFDEKTKHLNERDKSDLLAKIFLAALDSGESAKIRLVLSQHPKLSDSSTEGVRKGIERLFLFGQDDLIREISPLGETIRDAIAEIGLSKYPEKLIPLLNSSWNLSGLIERTIREKQLSVPLASEIIQEAIDLNADINKRPGHFGERPLEIALQKRNFDLARVLMDKGADPLLAADSFLNSPINLELIKYACKKGLMRELEGEPSFLHKVTDNLYMNREEMGNLFQELVEEGADVNALFKGETPFSKIVASGNKKLYDFCLQHHADMKKVGLDKLLAAAARNQSFGWELMARDLVAKGANLNAPLPGQVCTPFSLIASRGSKSFVAWCLDQGALVNPENPNFQMQPLHAAAIRTDEDARDVFKFLVEKGALLNQRGYGKVVPTTAVITKGDLSLLQFCFDQGAILDEATVKAAFINAIKSGNPEIIPELVNRGYQFSMSALSEYEAADLLKEAYSSSMLEKVLELKPSRESVQKAAQILQDTIVRKGDLKAMRLFEAAGANFDTTKIIESNFLFSTSPPSELSKELLGRLDKEALKEFLNKNLGAFSSEWLHYALANGADPNMEVESLFDTLPLIFEVVKRKNPEQVRTVLDEHPDLAKTYDKKTVLEFAIEQGNQEIVQLLKEALKKKAS